MINLTVFKIYVTELAVNPTDSFRFNYKRTLYTGIIALSLLHLAGCASLKHDKWSDVTMDETTRTHPATQQFIDFANAAKNTSDISSLSEQFFTKQSRRQLEKSHGWKRLIYSASFFVLNQTRCNELTLTTLTHRQVFFDCLGDFKANSPIIGPTEEKIHLRTYMYKSNNEWLIDRSGYVHTHTYLDTVAYKRGGIKFNSRL